MKIKFIISTILFLLVSIYLFTGSFSYKTNEVNAVTESSDTNFIIGCLHDGFESDYSKIDTLGFNLWHKYNGGEYESSMNRVLPTGWTTHDKVLADSSQYISEIRSKLDAIYSHNDRKTLMQRPKIEWLCFGQRSDYQCEDTNHVDPDLWFYSFNEHSVGKDTIDNSGYGNSQYVRYCKPDINQTNGGAGWVVKRLKANTEQSRGGSGWFQDSLCEWKVKPSIRIDSAIAHGTQNLQVCKIIVLNQNRDTLKSVEINARDFLKNNNYNGKYIEEFNFTNTSNLTIPGNWGNLWVIEARGNQSENVINNHTDIQVYWYGQCEMWIDYVRVDNDVADRLLKPGGDVDFEKWLRWEARDVACYGSSPFRFYLELFEYNNIPCMSYVSRKLDSLVYSYCSKHITLMDWPQDLLYSLHVPWEDRYRIMNLDHFLRNYVEKMNISEIFLGFYPLVTDYDPSEPTPYPGRCVRPNTLPINSGQGMISNPIPPEAYEDSLQDVLDHIPYHYEPGWGNPKNPPYRFGGFRYVMKLGDTISKIKNSPFNVNPQTHLWFQSNETLREPTNEELDLMSNIPITYGARGLIYFGYESEGNFGSSAYHRGILELDSTPRYYNNYGQEKWNKIKSIVKRMQTWSPYIMSFDNANRHSFIYRLERTNMINQTYLADLYTYKPSPSNYSLASTDAEQQPSRYVQVGIFENPNEQFNKYFMIVNRRCSPYYPDTPSIENGIRLIKIKFDSCHSDFSGFNNWKIIDIDSNKDIATFNKNIAALVDLGWFLPGEGKLYKLAPVMQEGGALVTNEDCSGEFDCKGEINNNGYDINIRPGTTINFADSTARIIMTEGDFKCGIIPSGIETPVYLKGKSGNQWKGLKLQNCPSVEIERTYFEDISPYGLYSTYAADIINCRFVNVSNCSFLPEPGLNAGAMNAIFTSEDDLDIEAYILNNHFEMDDGEVQALTILTSGYVTFPVLVEGNTFVSSSGNSFNAMLFAGVEGGAVKNNNISGYKNGIILIWSAMDFFGNTFSGGDEDSKGILLYASSYANLAETGIAYTGGSNSISCEGENAKCMEVDYSLLYLNKGFNTFDIKNYHDGNAFHLSGTLSDEMFADPVDATQNCFQMSEFNSEAIHNMMWPSQDTVNYNFLDYNCDGIPSESMIAFDLGHGKYDTIYTESSGSGGGKSNYELQITNYEFKENAELAELITVRSLEDSVSLNLRKRDYERVADLCYELLTDHIDSLKDVSIISKLYLAELRLESSGNRITNLKSFLEEFILNNPDKVTFVKQSFYVIQKCKVSLEMYESAMSGFQEIINQNPYSYDGLVASWDFSATSLLYSLNGGSGGGISNYELGIKNYELKENETEYSDDEKFQILNSKSQIFSDDPKDKYDSKRFTKEDSKVIKSNVVNSFQTSREKEIEIVKSLEKKVREGNANKNEKSELKVKKTLSEVIKIKKPKDISEHINIIYGNIQKVFSSVKDNSSNEIINIIPTEYSLSQNYPNPFNPVTHLEFGISYLEFVTLIVYDVLGREVKTLVNEIKPAGKYKVEFDGSNFASGVYFYRLEAGDFVQTKRMVLVK